MINWTAVPAGVQNPGRLLWRDRERRAWPHKDNSHAQERMNETSQKKLKKIEGNTGTVARDLAFIFLGSFMHMTLLTPAFTMT